MRIDYLKQLVYYILVGLVLFILGRIVFMATFVPFSEIKEQSEFMNIALWNAWRFDIQTIAYITALPSILCIFGTYLKKQTWISGFIRWFYTIVYTIVSIIIVADICFYKNFSDHFNVTVFDFFNEEPLTLVQTFFEEYPVIWILVAIVFVFFALFKLSGFMLKRLAKSTNTKRIHLLSVVWIALVFVAMRGSVTEFPLQVEDMYVSPSQSFNACVPNATYCLKKAWQEKDSAFAFDSNEDLLKQYGFKSMDEAWETLGNKEHSLFSTVTDTTAVQPDIVVMLSESWSGYLVKYALEQKDDKLLCGMRKHLEKDVLFQNYQSVQNGTIATIENLLISTPFPRVFTSKYQYLKFPTSFAEPFFKSGYSVTFLSGMDEGWENIGTGLKSLGINKVFKYELLKAHPEYKFNSVGIYDHYVMNSLYEMLAKPSAKPRLIFVMTTTNHPPFVYPDDVKLPIVEDSFYDKTFLSNSKEVEESYIKGFQYANYSMNWFLDKVKNSRLKDNTLVLITGDHNVRTALKYADDGKCAPTSWEHRVPLYMLLPKTVECATEFNKDVWGCHYDIVTTLAPFAFKKGTKYLSIGQNLLSDTLNEKNSYSYNVEKLLFDKQNSTAKKKANARELLLRVYLQDYMKSKK